MVTQWQQLFYEDRFVSQSLSLLPLSSGLSCLRTPFKKCNADSRFNVGPYASEGKDSTPVFPFQAYCVSKHSPVETFTDRWSCQRPVVNRGHVTFSAPITLTPRIRIQILLN